MEMEKKNIAIIVLAVALVASGVGNIILALRVTPQPTYNTLVRGTGAGPHTIDPQNCWDSASSDVILQVCEGLFTYDLTNVYSMPRVLSLATGYHWKDTVTLQVTLRQGVMFHDGAVWNSTSAIWNWNRIMLLTNSSGDLPVSSPLAEAASLYFFNITYNDDGIMNGGTPIIKSVTAQGAWNITFVLNAPFAPFLDLLCFEGSLMTSPKSTPADRFLNLDEKLVGTGPYKFDSFTPNVDVRFSRNENYWKPAAGFQKMVFSIIQDPVTLNNAMLGGQLDLISGIIPSLVPQYEADKNIFVWHITDDTGVTGLSYYYLGFNNVLINTTMRAAISYAINYSYIIEQMSHNLVFRANSPIAPGYGSAYNASVKAADFNLAKARQTLMDEIPYIGSLGLTANNDTTGAVSDAWKALDLGDYNYSYNTDNSFRSDLLVPLQNWCEQIGVHVIDNGGTWDDFLTKLYVTHNQLGLYWVGWGPDYLDPFNMLDPLFNPASSSDSAQVDDAFLNSLLEQALKTTDQTARDNIYKHIQSYMANHLFPHAFGYHPKLTAIHGADIYGVNYNAMGKFVAYGLYRGPPRPFSETII